jgi:hypothetical protein
MNQAPKGEHEQKLTISVDVFIPDHPDRSDSPIFRATHKKLIGSNPNACCEVNNEHCDKDHPLELHHRYVEWCDSLGVDWEKVARLVPDFDWKNFDPAKPETFIDSEWNANQVLCKKHHIGKDHGKHYLPEPIWNMQALKRSDFIFSPDEE